MNKIKILKQLIHIHSITDDRKTCTEIIKISKNILEEQGVKPKTIMVAKRPILIWGELDLDKTKWLINSHLDVVPGNPNQFIPRIERGKVWGRGSADTKSSCAIMLANTTAWNNFARTKHITFMLVADEEVGGESTKAILSRMSNLKGGIFLEPTGEKMIVQAKGIIQIKITASGAACHGSRPWEGKSALELLTSNLTKFREANPSPLKETRITTFNFSLINSGEAINQIPGDGSLWCDIRWNPQDNPRQIISDIEKIFVNCTVEVAKLESTINCPKESKLRKSFVKSLKNNVINPISGFEHGSSDARHCTALGIPAIVFGPRGKNLHAEGEWVSLNSIERVRVVLDHWIKNI